MSERPSGSEEVSESIPIPEEVLSVFEKLLEGKTYETRRQLEDEQGLYLWEIKISGGNSEFAYGRKGNFKEGKNVVTSIYRYDFDEMGIPEPSSCVVAKYENDEWELIP